MTPEQQRRASPWFSGLTGLAILLLLAAHGSVASEGEAVDAESIIYEVPDDLTSMIVLKLLLLDEDLPQKAKQGIVVGVVGSPSAAEAFARHEGKTLDRKSAIRLLKVFDLASVPEDPGQLTLLFAGLQANPDTLTAFTREHKILSATNVIGYVERGVTIGVVPIGNRPKVLLNEIGSKREGVNWSPKMKKIAQIIR